MSLLTSLSSHFLPELITNLFKTMQPEGYIYLEGGYSSGRMYLSTKNRNYSLFRDSSGNSADARGVIIGVAGSSGGSSSSPPAAASSSNKNGKKAAFTTMRYFADIKGPGDHIYHFVATPLSDKRPYTFIDLDGKPIYKESSPRNTYLRVIQVNGEPVLQQVPSPNASRTPDATVGRKRAASIALDDNKVGEKKRSRGNAVAAMALQVEQTQGPVATTLNASIASTAFNASMTAAAIAGFNASMAAAAIAAINASMATTDTSATVAAPIENTRGPLKRVVKKSKKVVDNAAVEALIRQPENDPAAPSPVKRVVQQQPQSVPLSPHNNRIARPLFLNGAAPPDTNRGSIAALAAEAEENGDDEEEAMNVDISELQAAAVLCSFKF